MRSNNNFIFKWLFLATLTGRAFGQTGKWAHELSDFPKDPSIVYGQLENGFKYAWTQRSEKRDHCFLRLMVHVGSLHESEQERGIAHFLEHLAFDGSKNFPKGTLIKWFQKNGMQMGPHLNAHTGFDETVYKIDMPRCTSERVKQALTVFRDFADGLLLEESEIEKERDIIDMEEQDRDSEDLRIRKKIFSQFYQGTTYADRLPIGQKDVRKDFDKEKIKTFYKKWYRPDNMTLVLVGDFASPESEIRDVFQTMTKDAKEFAAAPNRGSLAVDHKEIVISEKNYPTIEINFLSTEQQEKPQYNKEFFFKEKMSQLVRALYYNRVSQHLLSNKKNFDQISLVDGLDLNIMRIGVNFNLQTSAWESGLSQATTLHNEIMTFGFSEDDLSTILSLLERKLKEATENEQPEDVLEELLKDARKDFPRIDPKTYMELYNEFRATLTLESLNNFLKDRFSKEKLFSSRTLIIGDFSEKEVSVEQIKKIIDDALKIPVTCRKSETLKFGYKFAAPEEEEEYSLVENKGYNYYTATFKNGVKAHLKKNTDPRMPNKILIKAKMGYGKWEFNSEDKALMTLGSNSLIMGGTKKHSLNQIETLIAKKDLSLVFTMDSDDSYFSGHSSPDDFVHYLEWNRAFIEDPAFGDGAVAKQKDNLLQDLTFSEKTYSGVLNRDYFKALYGNDMRFSSLTKKQIEQAQEGKVVSWMKNNLLNRCPEFSIVGEIEIEKVTKNLYEIFGGLKCNAIPSLKEDVIFQGLQPGVNRTYYIASENPQALVGFFWPMRKELEKNRILISTIESLIANRTRDLLREDLSIAYTPDIDFIVDNFPWNNQFLYIAITTDPSQTDIALKSTPKIIESFSKKPVTKGELERAKNPLLEEMNLLKTSTPFWLNAIPVRNANFVSSEDAVQYLIDTTPEQINSAIIDLFPAKDFSSVVIKPKKK